MNSLFVSRRVVVTSPADLPRVFNSSVLVFALRGRSLRRQGFTFIRRTAITSLLPAPSLSPLLFPEDLLTLLILLYLFYVLFSVVLCLIVFTGEGNMFHHSNGVCLPAVDL